MRRVQRDTCHGDGWMRRRGVDWDRICIADLHSLPVRLNNKVVMGPTRVDRHGWRGHIIGMPMNERLFLFRRKAIKVKISIISFFFIFITACLRHRMGFLSVVISIFLVSFGSFFPLTLPSSLTLTDSSRTHQSISSYSSTHRHNHFPLRQCSLQLYTCEFISPFVIFLPLSPFIRLCFIIRSALHPVSSQIVPFVMSLSCTQNADYLSTMKCITVPLLVYRRLFATRL